MAFKSVIVCALLVKMMAAQCNSGASISNWASSPAASCGCGSYASAPLSAIPATSGGGFSVISSSPISPTGVYITSDHTIEGPLNIAGQTPFLGTVALEGQVPANGQAGVQYSCGNNNIGITSEGASNAAAAGVGIGLNGLSLGNAGLARWNAGSACGSM